MSGPSSSGSSTTQQTSTTQPWSAQQPYLTTGMAEALKQYQSNNPQYFPGTTVVPQSPETLASLGIKTSQAIDPNSILNEATGETQKTLQGDYLSPDNPVYQGVLDSVQRQVRPGVDTGFEAAGRSGTSPLHTEALARGIATGMQPYLQAERGRQYQSSIDAGTTSQYAPNLLGQVGAANEGQMGAELQDAINRFNFGENVDAAKLQQYMKLISGNYGGTTTGSATSPIYSNPLQSGLGAGAGLASIGTSLFAPPGASGGGGLITGNK